MLTTTMALIGTLTLLTATVAPATGPGPDGPARLAAGNAHTCMLDAAGRAYCWGYNYEGQLGHSGTANRSRPIAVKTPAGIVFTQITAGDGHTCALARDLRAYCWGDGRLGQLGYGGTADRRVPTAVKGPTFTYLTAGDDHTCGLGADGRAYCWGNGEYGQLGDGRLGRRSVPGVVPAPVRFTQLSAGAADTCGLGVDGRVFCWGNGVYGQLGDGGTVNRPRPVAVRAPSGVTFTLIAAGGYHTCGLGRDTKAYCWGQGTSGQLGDGGTANRSRPGPVKSPAGVRFTRLAAGSGHTCGLGGDTRTYCWGQGGSGELGDGNRVVRLTPVAVKTPAGVTFTQLTAGESHTCGLAGGTRVYCWGEGLNGRLGDSTNAYRLVPAAVTTP
ncbi:hypothetical protein Aca07nite_85520 [Actinoplanes capillaceus]|uniref:RCC1-like domain-containing protein n=1 Tax=Actinoplanes campanulatus TaxID=113559 RepID=A0ABQ3WYA7_9ACTN|nr:hypothetical protein [Actinoplanes capillaceus]GID51277.1 hypothetical protein Aca07nite_85520 [Actinoplanes capillaceus]